MSFDVILNGNYQNNFFFSKLTQNDFSLVGVLTWMWLCRESSEPSIFLRKDSFEFEVDARGVEYKQLCFNEAIKNHPGGVIGTNEPNKHMYATGEELRTDVVSLQYESWCDWKEIIRPVFFTILTLMWILFGVSSHVTLKVNYQNIVFLKERLFSHQYIMHFSQYSHSNGFWLVWVLMGFRQWDSTRTKYFQCLSASNISGNDK